MSASLRWYYKHRERLSKERAAKYAANRTEYNKRNRHWAVQNPDKVKKILKRYNEKNPNRSREAHWRKAGINVEQARALVKKHDGFCAICKTDKPGGNKGWHLDHNHNTGEARGLLCCGCNLRLGWLEIHHMAVMTYLGKR